MNVETQLTSTSLVHSYLSCIRLLMASIVSWEASAVLDKAWNGSNLVFWESPLLNIE